MNGDHGWMGICIRSFTFRILPSESESESESGISRAMLVMFSPVSRGGGFLGSWAPESIFRRKTFERDCEIWRLEIGDSGGEGKERMGILKNRNQG